MKIIFGAFLLVLLGTLAPGSVWSRVFLSQEEALRVAFASGTAIERQSVFLTDGQKKEIESRARTRIDSAVVTYYVGRSASGLSGCAFFETHTVRTMPETLMAVIDPDGSLRMVEILAFNEPEDYLPPKRWLGLFRKKKLTSDLWVKRGIRNIAGATITTQAITETVRRLLATYHVAIEPTLK